MIEIKDILDYIVLPLIAWIWSTDRELVKLKASQIVKDDLEAIYLKMDGIKDEIHKNFVSSKTCDFRHKK